MINAATASPEHQVTGLCLTDGNFGTSAVVVLLGCGAREVNANLPVRHVRQAGAVIPPGSGPAPNVWGADLASRECQDR